MWRFEQERGSGMSLGLGLPLLSVCAPETRFWQRSMLGGLGIPQYPSFVQNGLQGV
jgi:hypothetical protein